MQCLSTQLVLWSGVIYFGFGYRFCIGNHLPFLFNFNRRSKYSQAKQEADEEKHLNQGIEKLVPMVISFLEHALCYLT